jgi:hypothetical protein
MATRKSDSIGGDVPEITLQRYLGRTFRAHRRQHALTISELAEIARTSPRDVEQN